MKKLATLLLAAGMVVAASAPANAVDVKVDARYRVSFMTGSKGFEGQNMENVVQRLRLGLTMAASENLSGYFQLQAGKDVWGTSDTTAGISDGGNLSTRMAYIDWTVPGTAVKVRMGRHQFGLPAEALGNNSVLASGYGTRDGVVVTAPVNGNLGLTAIWARTGHNVALQWGSITADGKFDNNDMDDIFAVAANLKFDGVSGAVFAAYGAIDGVLNAKGDAPISGSTGLPSVEGEAYWAGFTSTFSFFDPFTLKLSAVYGVFNADSGAAADEEGWNVQAKASYKTAFGTPFLAGWYISGNNEAGRGMMPNAGYFTPTRSYHDAAKGLAGLYCSGTMAGSWGVQAGIEGVSFVENLTHALLVTFMRGTNNEWLTDANGKTKSNNWVLGEDDTLTHIDFVNTYNIYKNLAAHLEFSYIMSDFDKKGYNADLTEDDWRAELCFEYKF